MQRLRQSLPYFAENGWQATVFAVNSERVEGAKDPLLLQTVPDDCDVHHVEAYPSKLTRIVGLGNLGFRSWFQLRRAVDQYLANNQIDLIFFSTTVFSSIAHGPHWKKKFGIPFVIDLQDPWRNDYYLALPPKQRPGKFWFDHWQKSRLEATTMPHTDGILSVSQTYIDTMLSRYPETCGTKTLVLPFGADQRDFDIAQSIPEIMKFEADTINAVYIGRGGKDMDTALSILFSAIAAGLAEMPKLFSRLRLHFLGTSYAPSGQGMLTVKPVAERYGIGNIVNELADRIPYFEALKILTEADILVVPGSNDTGYTASKIYPYILAKKPLIAVFRDTSSVGSVLEKTNAGQVVTFEEQPNIKRAASTATRYLQRLLEAELIAPQTNWSQFETYTARHRTKQMTIFFDQVTDRPGL